MPVAAPRLAPLSQVLQWAGDPDARRGFSPLGDRPFLLFEAEGEELSAAAQARARAWLRELPCPSLAVAATPGALTPACDVVLDGAGEAGALIENIRRSPIAAAVLVQLLRATETLTPGDALTAESLAYATLQGGPEFRRWLEANRAPAPAQHGDDGPAVLIGREGDSLRLELNRPSLRNGMTLEMRDALVEALQLVLSDESIHQVHLCGRGKCFSTGGELSEFGTAPDPATAHAVRSLALPGRLLAACAARVEARLHGACIGSGIEFPAFAGRVVARSNAHFQLPELRFGLIPGAGGCVSVARRIGRQRTAWLVLSGERIRAAQALEWGLVDAIADEAW
jgi:enoyl-CoA hydratase/carnithine racemase